MRIRTEIHPFLSRGVSHLSSASALHDGALTGMISRSLRRTWTTPSSRDSLRTSPVDLEGPHVGDLIAQPDPEVVPARLVTDLLDPECRLRIHGVCGHSLVAAIRRFDGSCNLQPNL